MISPRVLKRNLHLSNSLLIITICILALQSCVSSQENQEEKTVSSRQTTFDLREAQVLPADYEYTDQETFKVLSWNVEHFVDEYDDPYIDAGRENEPNPEMKEKVMYLVEALKNEDADVVILQEFESSKFLRQIAAEHLEGMGYDFFASATSDNWYMNVVVMSKFPLGVMYAYGNVTTPVVDFKNEEGLTETQSQLNTRMWSLEVFPAADYDFILTGLHLKAGRGERNESMRLGQINFLKHQFKRFLSMNPSQNLLVAGDLNSTLGSKEIQALKQGSGTADKFYDPLPEEVFTHSVENPSRRLDYILYNGNMENEYVQNSAQVPSLLDEEKLKVLSDHLPLIIRFKKTDQ
ncbi:endonuclease/exonuclease/phosphatase family protein [Psychroflexus montanilacus]|uniref:endonuclease/exonuclease/phosphatase family protein n=1 Tax=Psychroflexus montanilacus TaxID=2873598 RepID=UPI001CC95CF8|nr:endonuclease/exonuclease/phosphatase family protein [Psychroflexus montanilacus]MBZ9651851.1 endonuclease/exonuclease/phosphatase family protein [Psychroflexus montanilacus]